MTPGTALVTGASKRIGRHIALALADAGWRVAIHYNASSKDAQALADEINATHGASTAAPIQADLSAFDDLERLVIDAADALGPVTALINNASVFTYDQAQTMSRESFADHFDVNLRAPVFLATAMARALPEGATGIVINLIDQRVWRPTPEFFSYSLAKAALWDATRMLAQALAPAVRVNGIGPGPVLRSVHQTADEFSSEAASTLLGAAVDPKEIAKAVLFIVDASAMTGQMIALDGGQHLAWTPEVTGEQ